jgi:glucosamine-6-phosphate deaminase
LRVYNSCMSHSGPLREFPCGNAKVEIYGSASALGRAAADLAAQVIRSAVTERGRARVIVATGNSQIPLIEALVQQDLDWKRVEIFHMDEYAGMAADHPASFRRWIRTRVEERVRPGKANYLAGDAPDLEAEMDRYSQLLNEAPIDLAFVGFGENGHIAFNDPHVADFNDPLTVKRITLDEPCRKQQAGEGHFKDVDSVPRDAVTVTCTGLFRANTWICCVPEARKAEAVRNALEGPISESCPASLVRRHPNAHIYLDQESSSLLSFPAVVSAIQ